MKIKINKEIQNSNNKFIFDLLNIDYYHNPISPYRFFYDYIKKNCNKIEGNICEFGVFQGRSLLSTALLLKKIRSKKKSLVLTLLQDSQIKFYINLIVSII